MWVCGTVARLSRVLLWSRDVVWMEVGNNRWSYIYISTLDKISYILSSTKFSIKIKVWGDLFVISHTQRRFRNMIKGWEKVV